VDPYTLVPELLRLILVWQYSPGDGGAGEIPNIVQFRGIKCQLKRVNNNHCIWLFWGCSLAFWRLLPRFLEAADTLGTSGCQESILAMFGASLRQSGHHRSRGCVWGCLIGRGHASGPHDGLRHSRESLEPHGGRGLSLQPRGGRPQPPKYFQAPN
jgi:hypothetical protein